MQPNIGQAILQLDRWFDSMRQPGGYGGPVAHWWESSLLYCGPMIDWRYEGLICGYLALYRNSQQPHWLHKAVQAADDVVAAQTPEGHFRNSSFQRGPLEGGTPHEAAVAVGLLELASTLRQENDVRWQTYAAVAERNLQHYQIGKLWNGTAFRDEAGSSTTVANKNATTLEALLLYRALGGTNVARYIHGATERILSAIEHSAGPRQGATVHLGTGKHRLAIGIYTARCAAALVRLYREEPQPRYLLAMQGMAAFLERSLVKNGSRFGYYADGRPINCPIWLSPSGDLLRALVLLQPFVAVQPSSIEMLVQALLRAQLPSGGMITAQGLGQRGQLKPHHGAADLRDLLPVVGWCDKAFHGLALLAPAVTPEDAEARLPNTALACNWKGRLVIFCEDQTTIQLNDMNGRVWFKWNKSACYPVIYQL
jgi:hypothetical protein